MHIEHKKEYELVIYGRFLFIANAGPFTLTSDVDRLADSIEATARASR